MSRESFLTSSEYSINPSVAFRFLERRLRIAKNAPATKHTTARTPNTVPRITASFEEEPSECLVKSDPSAPAEFEEDAAALVDEDVKLELAVVELGLADVDTDVVRFVPPQVPNPD